MNTTIQGLKTKSKHEDDIEKSSQNKKYGTSSTQ